MSLNKNEIYEFGDFRLDVDERTIERIDGGQLRTLPTKTFDALVLLVRKRGHLVTRDEFLEHVWPDTIVEENNLEKRVHQLRQFLSETDGGSKHIETVRGHGYRFVAPVHQLEVSDSWLPVTHRDGGRAGNTAAARGAASSAPGGIAVLPFANMTDEAEQEHFADGIVEDLLTRLQATDGISVVSRQSSFAYKNRSVDARTIARELECRYVVEGSVRKVGDRVRVSAQLIDALTDRHVWAERYDRRLEDAFQLQDEICDEVVAAFNDRPYQYTGSEEAPPLDRSAGNGIRCMRTMQGGPASEGLRKPVTSTPENYAALEPVGDAAYSVLAQQLEYRSVPFTPRVEEVHSSNPAWTRQRVEVPTGYDTGTFAVQLFLPTGHAPPYQVVFVMPDGGDFLPPITTAGLDPSSRGIPVDFLLKSGRALAVVAFDGTFERRWPAERQQSMADDERVRTRLRHWRQELGRTIDYFATRQDLDARKLGWFGVSSSASGMMSLMAVEKRIGVAVLYSGGIAQDRVLPMSERPFNYYPRVTQPVLMLNGRWDILYPLPSQQRMLELLGTPEDSKKHVLFEAGHGNLPRFQVEHATLDWFALYLGQPAKK